MDPRRQAIVGVVVGWNEVEAAAPEFAGRVRALFDAGTNKTLATIRADGSPRISGIETEFVDGELRLGMMLGSRKLADVRRDPRVALHSPTLEPPARTRDWPGDAKIAGVLHPAPATEGGPEGRYFAVDIDEVVLTRMDEDAAQLVIESWTTASGFRVLRRT